jgi:hypothetical protein
MILIPEADISKRFTHVLPRDVSGRPVARSDIDSGALSNDTESGFSDLHGKL